MRLHRTVLCQLALLSALLLLLVGCGSLIADYSLDAYKNATTLKAETAALIDKSNEPYDNHANAVDDLTCAQTYANNIF